MRISEEIAVAANPERAWQAVIDYPSRATYSGRVGRAEVLGGALVEGAKIALQIDRRTFAVTVTSLRPPNHLETSFGIRLLYSGKHAYTVSPNPNGATVRIDGDFAGLLGSLCTPLMRSSVARDLRDELVAISRSGGPIPVSQPEPAIGMELPPKEPPAGW